MADALDDPLQRYQVMEPLGRGGSGTTFRGIDRATRREVAIKVLSLRSVGGDWKRFDLFEREVAVLGALSHPGIPHYIDSYSSEATGDYFLVMELVDGTPLSQRMREHQRLAPAALRDLVDQALEILDYLHTLSPPVIHRDIKPANLVIDAQGRLHLVDFGGVRRAMQAGGSTTMIGTFGYMAPEQLHGESGPSTDLYALGATIVALHTGVEADQLPHDGLNIDLAALDVPEALAEALKRMLEPDPKQRVRSVAEVRQVLGAAAFGSGGAGATGSAGGSGGSQLGRADRSGRGHAASEPRSSNLPAARPEVAPLVELDGIRTLARVPAPLSILVWFFTALGAGGLTVFQVLLMPLLFHLARHFGRKEPVAKRAELETNLARAKRTVIDARRSLAYVAGQTHPLRDGDEDDEAKER